MNKTDKSKHNISIAAIKRCTFKPYDYNLTKFYESNIEFDYSDINIELQENELIVCSTVIDSRNYSILTTQKLITRKGENFFSETLIGAKDKGYGDFKGYNKEKFTFGVVELANGSELEYFIETGKASMIMIHGVRTIISTEHLTEQNMKNRLRNYTRQNLRNGK